MSAMQTEPKVESSYLLSEEGPNDWLVRKVEPSEAGPRLLAEYPVRFGQCPCEGFQRHLSCRHVRMVQHNPQGGAPRAGARKAAMRLAAAWENAFDRLVFDEYVEDTSGTVRFVKMAARGQPVRLGGHDYWKILAVYRGAIIEIHIGR